jgi:hypothetical protein
MSGRNDMFKRHRWRILNLRRRSRERLRHILTNRRAARLLRAAPLKSDVFAETAGLDRQR